jgi:hypothetical protein
MHEMELGREHRLALMRVDAADQAEAQRADAAAEAAQWRTASSVGVYREVMELARMQADARDRQAEDATAKADAERTDQLAAEREGLLLTGAATWRTVPEILAAARGQMLLDDRAPTLVEDAETGAAGAPDPLEGQMARAWELTRALDEDPVLVRAKSASRARGGVGALDRYPHRPPPVAWSSAGGEITRTTGDAVVSAADF